MSVEDVIERVKDKKYISVEDEESYMQEVYDSTIGEIESFMFLTGNWIMTELSQTVESPSKIAKVIEEIKKRKAWKASRIEMGKDDSGKDDIIINLLEFLIKENLRLTTRVINLSGVLSDKLRFTPEEEDSVMNPNVNYEEENRIIEKLKGI